MFSSRLRLVRAAQKSLKLFSICGQRNYKVTVIGATSNMGQQLCLWLVRNPMITTLTLWDDKPILAGVAADVSHIDTCTYVTSFLGHADMYNAVRGADVVVVLDCKHHGGELFETNAKIVQGVCEVVARETPDAILAIVAGPINSMVPIAAGVMKKAKKYDKNRILGVTTVNGIRANKFTADYMGVKSKTVFVPVIGGASPSTIIPLFSQSKPCITFCRTDHFNWLLCKIRCAECEVMMTGGSPATLCTSYAVSSFVASVLKGLSGEQIVEYSYVRSPATEAAYFVNPVVLGPCGVMRVLGIGSLSSCEMCLYNMVTFELIKDIQAGLNYLLAKKS